MAEAVAATSAIKPESGELPHSNFSASVARKATGPTPPNAMRASRQVPFCNCNKTATPTMARSPARWVCLR